MAAGEQVIRAPAQLGVLLRAGRRQQGLSQQDLALKAGGTSQARFSQLELQPGRFTVERLLLILAPPLPGKMTPLQPDQYHPPGGLMEQSNASLQRDDQS